MHNSRFGNDFLDMIAKAQATKETTDKLDFMKIVKFCISEDTTNRVKRQTTKWGKMFENHISDTGLIAIIYKELLKLKTEQAMATHSTTLAWKIPWMEEPHRLQSMGSLRVGHD